MEGPADRGDGRLGSMREWTTLVGWAVAGGGFGFAMSSIPAPPESGIFWVGNFSSPWAVIAFLCGWSLRSRGVAAVAGAVTLVACVAGFYAQFLFVGAARLGLPDATPWLTVAATGVTRWLVFVAPWMLVAVPAGAVYGLLGRQWGKSRSIICGVAIALALIAEPAAWWAYTGLVKGPVALWVVEIALGLALLAWFVAVSTRARATAGDRR